MDKQKIFQHYSSIIDTLIDNSLWFETYFQNPWYLDQDIDGYCHDELPASLNIKSGATRTCLIDEDYDWVIKFDTDEDNYGSVCEREERIYNAAKQFNYEKYFAEVAYIGIYTKTINFYPVEKIEQYCEMYEYNEQQFTNDFADNEDNFGPLIPITISIHLYAYRRADEYNCTKTSAKEVDLASKVVSPLRSRNIAVAANFIREYGMKEYVEFSKFSIKWHINDLHLRNIGTIDGHFCLIDYGGYHNGYNSTLSE